MDGKRIYTSISEKTVRRSRDRVLNELNVLTGGEALKAISLVEEYNELESICKDIEKEREDKKAELSFSEMIS